MATGLRAAQIAGAKAVALLRISERAGDWEG